jgi:hypothetical protein
LWKIIGGNLKTLLLLCLIGCATQTPIVKAPAPARPAPIELTPATPAEKKVIFTAKSTLQWVKDLADVANCVAGNEAFYQEIAAFPDYDFTDMSSLDVANAYRNMKPIDIRTYWYFMKSVIATTYTTNETSIYLNTRSNPRPMPEMINTTFHEGGHLIGFSHGDNKPFGKENSVNYRVGSIAVKYAEGCR